MIEAFRLFGQISLEGADEVQEGIEGVADSASGAVDTFEGFGSSFSLLVKSLLAGAVALGTAGIAVATVGVKYNTMLESSGVAWKTLLGTQDKAEAQLERIGDFAKTTQFDFESVDQMAKYMHNAGLEGDALYTELGKVADVSGAFSIPADQASEMARQMAQVRNAGVAYTEDLNILEDKGVPIMKTIAKQLGITTAEAKEMASEGEVTSEIYLAAFDEIAKGVKGASEDQSKTFGGMISAMEDNLNKLAGLLAKPIFDKMKEALAKLMPIVEKFVEKLEASDYDKKIEAIFKWLWDNGDVIISIIAGIAGAFLAFHIITIITKTFAFLNAMMVAFQTGTVMATLAQWGFNTALLANPILWVAIGIGILIAVIIMLWIHWDTVSAWLKKSWKKIKELWADLMKFLKNEMEKNKQAWADFKEKVSKKLEELKASFRQKVDEIKAKLEEFKAKVIHMKDTVVNKFLEMKTKVVTTFNKIKDAIVTPIKAAMGKVEEFVEKIKGFFTSMKLKLPSIKTPTFGIKNWSKNPADWLKAMPKLTVSWHAKGGLLDGPSFLGMSGSTMHMGGESGKEGILPLEGKHMLPMAEAIANYLGGGTGGRIEVPLYLNGREIARAIAPNIDQELKRQNDFKRRGV